MGDQNSRKIGFPLRGKSNSCYSRRTPNHSQSAFPHALLRGFLGRSHHHRMFGGWTCLPNGSNSFSYRGRWVNVDITGTSRDFSVVSWLFFMTPNPCALELTNFLASQCLLFSPEQPGASLARPGSTDGSQPLPQGASACTHFFQWSSQSDLMDIPGLMTHQHGIFLLLLG